ncbi:MAG: hypothetical protein Q7T50_02925 [Candidatus Magasanikbacteria bacterium]|nr:hypothetical protein [Candidatus Magasanikbacteria bacterium]
MEKNIIAKMTKTGEIAVIPGFIPEYKINEFKRSSHCNLSVQKGKFGTTLTRKAGGEESKWLKEDELFTELGEFFAGKVPVIQAD